MHVHLQLWRPYPYLRRPFLTYRMGNMFLCNESIKVCVSLKSVEPSILPFS
jgi:hypothetical protein